MLIGPLITLFLVALLIWWRFIKARGEGRIRNFQCWNCGAVLGPDNFESRFRQISPWTKAVPLCESCEAERSNSR